MKRKFLVIASVVLLCAASAFADKETDLNFYITPVENYNIRSSDVTGHFYQKFAFGLEGQMGFIFGSPSEVLDIGMNLSFGADMLTGYSYEYKNVKKDTKESGETDAFGMNMHVNLGPLFRINFGDMHSIYISPGAKLGFGFGVSTDEEADSAGFVVFNAAIAADLGYRLWVSDSFGVSAGVDLAWDMFGFAHRGVVVAGGFGMNIYVGLCFK